MSRTHRRVERTWESADSVVLGLVDRLARFDLESALQRFATIAENLK